MTTDELTVLALAKQLDAEPATQTLVVEDFPSPELALTLSPNGRAHWAVRQKAKNVVRDAVWTAWVTRQFELVPVHPPVHVTYRWIVPDRKHRDIDNASTGVVKVAQDTLVRLGMLPGGDHSTVLTSHTEIVYEKGQRRLEIVLTPLTEQRAPVLGAGAVEGRGG